MADALVGIGADLSALTESLKSIPNLAGTEADKAIRKVQQMSIRASRGVSRAIRQQARDNARAQKAAERAARAAAREAEKQADAAREAGKGLAEIAGIGTDKFDKLRAVMEGLKSPIGRTALAFTGVGLAIVGAVAGTAALASGMVSLQRTARDLLDELAPLQAALGIEQATVDRITAANDALDAAAAAGKAVAIVLADILAPGVERTAVLFLKLGLMSRDALNAIGGGASLVGQAFELMARIVLQALSKPLARLLDMFDALRAVARIAGFRELTASLDGLQMSFQQIGIDAVEGSFQALELATSDYDDEARKLLGTVEQVRRAQDRGSRSTEKDTAARKEQAAGARQAAAALQAYRRALSAAQAPFVDRSEVATLGRLRQALVDTADAAQLTAEQALQTQAALAQIDARLMQIRVASERAFEPLQTELQNSAQLAAVALDDMSAQITESFARIPWARVWGAAIVDTAREAGAKAAGIILTLTGGALDALRNPAALLGAIGEAAGPNRAKKLADSLANQAIHFVQSLADNIGPFITAITDRIPDIIVALAKAAPVIVVEIVKAVPQIVKALFVGIARGIVALARSIARQVKKAVRDVVSVSGREERVERRRRRRRRRRVSDTPGPIRVDRETTVAPGDYLAAARTPAGLRAQVGSEPAPLSVTTVIDVRDGPVRLGMAISTRREVDRLGVGRNSSGRVGVY